MYLKSAVVFGGFVATYVVLVFFTTSWGVALPLAALLGLACAGIGFNIQHDGGHGAYSDRRWVNRLSAMALDLLGGSSYIWARKHNAFHHTYPNITGHDDDIDVGVLGRLSPHQKRLRLHRFQHFYMWALYGFLPIKWHFVDDFRSLITGRIGEHRFARPKGWDLLFFFGGKVTFFTLAFGVPMWVHPWSTVVLFYVLAMLIQGVVLSVVFQLAHCVEEAEFPMPLEENGRMQTSWAAHQVQTTVDFAPRNRVLSWLLGGLNFQTEHHLFPHISHAHYPAIAPIVAQTCKEFGLNYRVNHSFFAGVASHFRWLRRMGMPVAEGAAA
ncbi:MAG: acyl-CoA desaturase [Planctomycetota bacterium]|nr:MAG: acyl-CoA desaturase [Planctomycetota bacterium]KAB2949755.1 MAG: acyl-CoA desaturase [Phycisphaerae bacterium]MCQ3921705.1 acyl-CoA desaturase [Planctomycetota bacterium]